MADVGADNPVSKKQPKVEPLATQILSEVQEGAKNALAFAKNAVKNVGQEIYDNPKTALTTLAVGAAALYLSKGKDAGEIGQALSKGEALDAKSLEVPSLFGKDGQTAGRKLFTEGLKDDAGAGQIDFAKGSASRASVNSDNGVATLANTDFTAGGTRFAEAPASAPESLLANTKIADAPKVVEETVSPFKASEDRLPPRSELKTIGPRTEDELRKLAESDNVYDRQEAAFQKGTPKDVQIKLASDSNREVKSILLSNRNAPSEAVDILSRDSDQALRARAAQHENLSPEAAVKLGEDESLVVRRAAYANKNMPPDALARESRNPDSELRQAIAGNESTPPDTLSDMASETNNWTMRRIIQYNKSTPQDLRTVLKEEEDRLRLAKAPEASAEDLLPLAKAPEVETRLTLAGRKNAPPEALRTLANDPDKFVKNEALSNQNIPPDALTKASTDPEDTTRWAVAANPSTPAETLRAMRTDKSFSTRRFVQKNPSTPEDVAAELRLEK
jgi:hypothetical protein